MQRRSLEVARATAGQLLWSMLILIVSGELSKAGLRQSLAIRFTMERDQSRRFLSWALCPPRRGQRWHPAPYRVPPITSWTPQARVLPLSAGGPGECGFCRIQPQCSQANEFVSPECPNSDAHGRASPRIVVHGRQHKVMYLPDAPKWPTTELRSY